MIIYVYIDSFWVLESNGFIPRYCIINILYMVEMQKENSGRIGENYEEIAKRKKAKSLIERIC